MTVHKLLNRSSLPAAPVLVVAGEELAAVDAGDAEEVMIVGGLLETTGVGKALVVAGELVVAVTPVDPNTALKSEQYVQAGILLNAAGVRIQETLAT